VNRECVEGCVNSEDFGIDFGIVGSFLFLFRPRLFLLVLSTTFLLLFFASADDNSV
jgi:hypothetical protein